MQPLKNGIIDITKADLSKVESLPDSRTREPKDVKFMGGMPFVWLFCPSCGKRGPCVMEENCHFACYLCEECAIKLAPQLAGMYIEPNVLFMERARREQIEKYGHALDAEELARALDDSESLISKLDREGRDHIRTGQWE